MTYYSGIARTSAECAKLNTSDKYLACTQFANRGPIAAIVKMSQETMNTPIVLRFKLGTSILRLN